MDEEKDTQSVHNQNSSEKDRDTESNYNQSTEEDEDKQSNSIQSSENEIEEGEEGKEDVKEEEKNERCPLSHPGDPHTLSRMAGCLLPPACCYACGEDRYYLCRHDEFYHHCATCDANFHNCCYDRPSKLLHPFHP
ncbi:unnamed protein product, partial [Arabidopsis halleri]